MNKPHVTSFKFKPSPPKVPPQGTWRDGPDGKGPCECGANQVFANAETRNGVPGSKAAGWFSRRHKTDHAAQEARTDREEWLTEKDARATAQAAKTKNAAVEAKAQEAKQLEKIKAQAKAAPAPQTPQGRRPAKQS